MRSRISLLATTLLSFSLLAASAAPANKSLTEAMQLREQGRFKEAAEVLSTALNDSKLSSDARREMAFQLDVLDRIKQDFSYTEEELFKELGDAVKGLTRDEFNAWMKEGRFESRMIDGVRYYAGTSVSNLFWRHTELNARRTKPKDISHYAEMLKNSRLIKEAAKKEKSPYVMPHRFRMTMTVTAKKGAAPAGETIRAWLPLPRKYPFQDEFKLLSSSSEVKYLADENSSIRSAYLEQPAAGGKTEFQVAYEYTRRAVRFDLSPADAKPYRKDDATYKQYTSEAPHVKFTPEIRGLVKKIVGDETNPVKKARAIYDWLGGNIKYSYALEYSTIPNISEYTRSQCYGDCGQQALLYITLCRAAGIPARWQSGWIIFPSHENIHDWTEIYIEPYGWVPVDAELGNALARYATNLTPDERKEVRDFYFGGLDQYRMIANCDHSQQLQPPKNTFRSDDVDFQRGELETKSKNIYFDKYSYRMDVEQLSPK